MAPFVNNPENIKSIQLDLIVDKVGKRSTLAAGKAMRPDVIAAFPSENNPHRFLYSLMKVVAKPLRNRGVT